MKTIFTISVTLFLFGVRGVLCQSESLQFPTFADPPGPENVLVVYKSPNNQADTISSSIGNHYANI